MIALLLDDLKQRDKHRVIEISREIESLYGLPAFWGAVSGNWARTGDGASAVGRTDAESGEKNDFGAN